jgi:hypothetical protein
LAVHVSSAHKVPTGQFWQPPFPSHLPLVLHVDCAVAVHIPRGSTVPAAIGVHRPSVACSEQLRQAPEHA